VPLGIVSVLDAPIFYQGRVRGLISHEQVGSPRRWAPEERDFATAVSTMEPVLVGTTKGSRTRGTHFPTKWVPPRRQ
jgi:hypothetical protein